MGPSTLIWRIAGGDHLGSTSLATDANGVVLSRQVYYAFGMVLFSNANG